MSGLVLARNVVSFEDLSAVVMGADLTTTQLGPGHCAGTLLHADLGNMQVSAGFFDTGSDIRMRGLLSADRITFAMILSPSGQISQWQQEALQGDLFVFPRNHEQDGRFAGHNSYVTIDIDIDQLMEAGTPYHLDDPKYWETTARHRAAGGLREAATRRIAGSITQLQRIQAPLPDRSQKRLKNQLLRAFLVQASDSVHGERYVPSVRNGFELVRRVEDFVLANPDASDVWRVCTELGVSRSTVQRAFRETLDRPPKLCLQRLLLSQAHAALRNGDPAVTTVREVAHGLGFHQLGRFAGLYHRLFGEYPSETLHRPSGLRANRQNAPDWRRLLAVEAFA